MEGENMNQKSLAALRELEEIEEVVTLSCDISTCSSLR
jgi:hypothetical protein